MSSDNVSIYNSYANKRVTISTNTVDYDFNNQLIGEPLNIPSTDIINTNTTKVKNLGKYLERFTINGFISTGLNPSASPPVERTNSADVRDDLITIAKIRPQKSTASTWTKMTYEGVTRNVTIEQMNIREMPHDLFTEAPDGVIKYDVKITVLVGDPLF